MQSGAFQTIPRSLRVAVKRQNRDNPHKRVEIQQKRRKNCPLEPELKYSRKVEKITTINKVFSKQDRDRYDTIEVAPKFYPLLMSQLLKNVFKNSYPIPYFDKCLTYYYCFWMSSLMYKRIQIFTPTLYFIFKIIFALIVLDTNFT